MSATDGHVFAVKDARGRYVAIHFLGKIGTPECAAFVREYLAKAPTVAGVVHIFAAGEDAGAVKKWAAQFKQDGASIHVDQGRELAAELKVAGEDASATVVFGPDGERLIFHRGRIFWSFVVDTKGDTDLDNDEFISDFPPSVAGPHPILDGVADFCDLLDLIR